MLFAKQILHLILLYILMEKGKQAFSKKNIIGKIYFMS